MTLAEAERLIKRLQADLRDAHDTIERSKGNVMDMYVCAALQGLCVGKDERSSLVTARTAVVIARAAINERNQIKDPMGPYHCMTREQELATLSDRDLKRIEAQRKREQNERPN